MTPEVVRLLAEQIGLRLSDDVTSAVVAAVSASERGMGRLPVDELHSVEPALRSTPAHSLIRGESA